MTSAGQDVVGEGWRWRWRAFLLTGIAALVGLETVAILALFVSRFHETFVGVIVDLVTLGAVIAAVGLVICLTPATRWPNRIATVAVVTIFGVTHGLITLFGLASFVAYAIAHIPPPLLIPFADPDLAVSLLSSVGISPAAATAFLLVMLAVHLPFYVPVASLIVSYLRQAGAVRFPAPGGRHVTAPALAILYLIGAAGMYVAVPKRHMMREAVSRSLFGDTFQMAPPQLMLARQETSRPRAPAIPLAHPRPVVLIIVDALRPDRMGVYNPALHTTPFLNDLLRAGTLKRVDRAYGSCSFSFCGIIGILSSRTWDDFGSRPTTVVDVLSRYGYRNDLILSGNHVQFGSLRNLYGAGVTEWSDETVNGAHPANNDLDVLRRLRSTAFPDPAKSFLYLHLMSVHSGSYLLPPFRLGGPTSDAGSMENMYPGPRYGLRYDLSVRQADEMIRRIFAILDAKGLLSDAVVLITADHGERLGEDGRYMHSGDPDERILSVPLLIYDRRTTSYPERPLAGHIDIAPTLVRAAGAAVPRAMDGIPLQVETARSALPFGTSGKTGAIVRSGDTTYQFLCNRETGEQEMRVLATGHLDGTSVPRSPSSEPLYRRLQEVFHHLRRAVPVNPAPC